MAVVSVIILALSALVSIGIWILGTGIPTGQHMGMGVLFLLVHGFALSLVANPRPGREWVGLIAAIFVVPVEVIAIMILAAIF